MSASDNSVTEWTRLSCQAVSSRVHLFYDFISSAHGYSIVLTDLCRVWVGSLTRDEIVTEAHNQSCSIDPSESTTQLRTLLSKLKQSLIEGQNELGLEKERGVQALSVRTKMKLPAPLRLLTWTFTLQEQDAAQFANTIIIPLIKEASLMRRQTESLVQVLKEKDHVLSKLVDKIDTSAIDLSLIFPGINGIKSRKHRIGINEASKHVPGMAAFDRTAWGSEFDEKHKTEIAAKSDFRNVLQDFESNGHADGFATDWTQNLSSLSKPSLSNDNTSESDTPQILRSGPARPAQEKIAKPSGYLDGSSTDSDFEEPEGTLPKAEKGKGNLDSSAKMPVGMESRESCSVLKSLEIADKQKTSPLHVTTPTMSDFESSDSDASSTEIKSASTKATMAKSKLGVIGGSKEYTRQSSSPPIEPTSLSNSTPPRKLGLLGGRNALIESLSKSSERPMRSSKTPEPHHRTNCSDTDSNPTPSPSLAPPEMKKLKPAQRSASPTQPAEPEEFEETIEERSKRKRKELKAKKANAGNVKKKKIRRF